MQLIHAEQGLAAMHAACSLCVNCRDAPISCNFVNLYTIHCKRLFEKCHRLWVVESPGGLRYMHGEVTQCCQKEKLAYINLLNTHSMQLKQIRTLRCFTCIRSYSSSRAECLFKFSRIAVAVNSSVIQSTHCIQSNTKSYLVKIELTETILLLNIITSSTKSTKTGSCEENVCCVKMFYCVV